MEKKKFFLNLLGLQGQFSQKEYPCHHLLILVSFKTCMTFVSLHKIRYLKNVVLVPNFYRSNSVKQEERNQSNRFRVSN